MEGRKLRLLIVAHAFPPQNATASHRAYSWARTWTDLGHDVHVLTPAKSALDGSMDMECDLAGIHVHEVPYILAPRRTEGVANADRIALSRVERWDWAKTATRRMRFSLAMFADPRLLAYFAMKRRGLTVLEQGRLDIIIATSPPEMTFFVARTLAERAGVPWVADFRDLWFRDMRLHQSRAASALSGPVNRWLVKGAALLVTVSRGLQKRLTGYLGRDVLVCYNGYFESEFTPSGTPHRWNDGRIHIVYTGRMYPGKRDPEPLFSAMDRLGRNAPDIAHLIGVDFYGFDDPWLRGLIDKYRLHERVTVHGFVPFRQSVAIQRAADVLLFLDWTDAQADGILTGKLFEYFASRRPILSVGRNKDSEGARLIAETHSGVTLTTDEEIEAYLRALAQGSRPSDPRSSQSLCFSREKQARELLTVIEQVCRPSA